MFPYHKHNFLCIKLVSYNKLKFSKFLSILIPLSVLSDGLCSPQMTTVSMTDFSILFTAEKQNYFKVHWNVCLQRKNWKLWTFSKKVIFHSFIWNDLKLKHFTIPKPLYISSLLKHKCRNGNVFVKNLNVKSLNGNRAQIYFREEERLVKKVYLFWSTFFSVGRPSCNFLVLFGWDVQDDTGRTSPASSHCSLQPRKGTATVAAAGWWTGNGKINGRQRLKTIWWL